MIALQQELRRRVILVGDPSGADLVAGADTSSWPKRLWGRFAASRQPSVVDGGFDSDIAGSEAVNRGGLTACTSQPETIHAAFVVWSRSLKKVVSKATASVPATVPYIPGLLAFREMPPLMAAWEKLTLKPEVVIVDGQGFAHPRRCGIACHFGVETGVPTVGCGKSRLVGWFDEPGREKGEWTELWDNADANANANANAEGKTLAEEKDWIPAFAGMTTKEKIGRVLRTRREVAPVFVSCGHLCDIEGANKLVLDCCDRYRLPEPIRAAHLAAGECLRNSR
jgi:deoxyribonuclease V